MATPFGQQTDLFLLGRVQDYLGVLLQQKQPDSLLARCWDEFYGIYDALIRRFVLARGLRGADVDDCLQSVWLDVAQRLIDFEHPGDRPGLRAWLYTLVRSRANDFFRSRSRGQTESLDQALTTGREPASVDASSDAEEERHWERALLETLLEDLRREVSAENIRLLEMRLQEGRNPAEVAAALNMTPQQVWYRQHRLLAKLRARRALYTGDVFGGS
jgi:RNA polymerase sigma factor (sigma-70 family)